MAVPQSGGDITLGELGRRIVDLTAEVRRAVDQSVLKELYDRDRQVDDTRFATLEQSIKNMATNRRQIMLACIGIFSSITAALIGAIVAGAHP